MLRINYLLTINILTYFKATYKILKYLTRINYEHIYSTNIINILYFSILSVTNTPSTLLIVIIL